MLSRLFSWAKHSVWRALLIGLVIEASLIFGYHVSIGFGPRNPLDPRALVFGLTQLPSLVLVFIVPESLDNQFMNIIIVAAQSLLQATLFGLLLHFLLAGNPVAPDQSSEGRD